MKNFAKAIASGCSFKTGDEFGGNLEYERKDVIKFERFLCFFLILN
jgi:hypothetical protein